MSKLCFGCMSHYSDEYTSCPYCGYEEGTPRQNTMHLEPGTILHARYMLGKVLGYGGFGVTYLAWDLISDTKAAIKEYLPNGLATRQPDETQVQVYSTKNEGIYKGGLERFMKEARQLKQFREVDGIVKIHDCFAENGTAYLVMEYLEGETLGEKLKREKKITPEEAAEIVLPLTKALETVHASGIIHRDISPDNIYLTKDGKVHLIDFGSARYDTSSGNSNFTVMIKHGYSPIEQYQSNSNQGSYTDVYALAATMYRAITGVIPPNSIERLSVMKTNGTDTLEPVRKLCSEASEELEAVLTKALSLDQSERTQTMERFEAELRAAFREKEKQEPVQPIGKEEPTGEQKETHGKGGILAGILAALVALLGIAVGVVLVKRSVVTVPNVTRMQLQKAQNVLEDLGLTWKVNYEFSDTVPKYRIMQQDIPVGTKVKKGTSLTVTLSRGKKELLSINIIQMPNKTEYYVGDGLDSTGLRLEAVYSDGSTETIIGGYRVSPAKLTNSGLQEITVTLNEKKATYYVKVQEIELVSVSVKTMPKKTTYYVGDKLDTTGLTLTAKYNNGTTKTVTSGFTCSGTALESAGTKNIIVTYGGKFTQFSANVKAVELTSISVKTMPKKTSYTQGDTLSTSGLSLNVSYSNGTTQTVSSGFTCSPTTLNNTGTQTITVTYSGKTTTFNVTVNAASTRLITWKDINAGGTYDSKNKFTGFLLECMFVSSPSDENGFTVSNDFGAQQGHTPFFVSSYNYMYFSFWLPNDTSIAGWHTVTLYHDGVSENVKFKLEYLGDYSHIIGTSLAYTGLGWEVTDWYIG